MSEHNACVGCEYWRGGYRARCVCPRLRRATQSQREALHAGAVPCSHDTRSKMPYLWPWERPAFRDPKTGRVYVVSSGISEGTTWMTAWAQVRTGERRHGEIRTRRPRYKSPKLPLRATWEEAVEDLRRHAEARGWEEVETR